MADRIPIFMLDANELAEFIRDTVAAALVAGANITITPDDAGNTITLAASGGGGGSLSVQDENGTAITGVTQLDFQGAGVTAVAGTGEVVVTIPGGGSGGSGSPFAPGDPDTPPTAPNAKDDEFDGLSSVTWVNTPTAPNAFNVNSTRPGALYLKSSGTAAAYVGKMQTVPGSYPYTFTSKMIGSTIRARYQRSGIILAPAGVTNTSSILFLGSMWNPDQAGSAGGWSVSRQTVQAGGTFGSIAGVRFMGGGQPLYLRVTVTSATSVSTFASSDGYSWVPIETGFNPGFTPGYMGFALNDETALSGVEGFFEFFRVS